MDMMWYVKPGRSRSILIPFLIHSLYPAAHGESATVIDNANNDEYVSVRPGPPDPAPLMGMILSGFRVYDKKSASTATSLDVDAVLVLLNGGLTYRKWPQHVSSSRGEVVGYLGGGFVNVAQLQIGWSSEADVVVRLRADIIFSERYTPVFASYGDRWGLFREGIAISMYAEGDRCSKVRSKWIFGMGIGLTI